MILGFKQQFKQPILTGTKIHTIREDKNDRIKPGMKLQLATGVRTKQYECFVEKECVSVQRISILYKNIQPMGNTLSILIDGRAITIRELNVLSRKDGFPNREEFLDFFDKDFTGKIIHWTDFKY